jgi:hypothetical protein
MQPGSSFGGPAGVTVAFYSLVPDPALVPSSSSNICGSAEGARVLPYKTGMRIPCLPQCLRPLVLWLATVVQRLPAVPATFNPTAAASLLYDQSQLLKLGVPNKELPHWQLESDSCVV